MEEKNHSFSFKSALFVTKTICQTKSNPSLRVYLYTNFHATWPRTQSKEKKKRQNSLGPGHKIKKSDLPQSDLTSQTKTRKETWPNLTANQRIN